MIRCSQKTTVAAGSWPASGLRSSASVPPEGGRGGDEPGPVGGAHGGTVDHVVGHASVQRRGRAAHTGRAANPVSRRPWYGAAGTCP